VTPVGTPGRATTAAADWLVDPAMPADLWRAVDREARTRGPVPPSEEEWFALLSAAHGHLRRHPGTNGPPARVPGSRPAGPWPARHP
jgi:hypothetical protein